MSEQKLTPEAEAIRNYVLQMWGYDNDDLSDRLESEMKDIIEVVTHFSRHKAQGLYTREEVFDMIEAAFDGHIEVMPGLKFKIKRDKLPPLPTPPKTEV